MTKCVYCGNEVIDSTITNVCQSCSLEDNYFRGRSVYAYDLYDEYQ